MSIAILSSPRPFIGEFNRIQTNAIKSWMSLDSNIDIFLIDDEQSTCSSLLTASYYSAISIIHPLASSPWGTPLIDGPINQLLSSKKYSHVCFVNTDIILDNRFVDLISFLTRCSFTNYICMGQRHNIDVPFTLDYISATDRPMPNPWILPRSLHPPTGMDYWIMPCSSSLVFPPFISGRPGMDSWLAWYHVSNHLPLIDATNFLQVLHQNHPYPAKKFEYFKDETDYNLTVAGGYSNMLSLRFASHLINSSGDVIRVGLIDRFLRSRLLRAFIIPALLLKRKFF
jgi:hypothetical protein